MRDRHAYPARGHVQWCCFRCLAVNSVLRLKPYLVVKIASDVLTEHCCQVCVLAMMFCRSDCQLCACVVSDCVPRVLACWHSHRPTWGMKYILYIWFSHFTLTETHRLLKLYGPVMCQNRPDVGNIIPINNHITARLFHILQHMPCD